MKKVLSLVAATGLIAAGTAAFGASIVGSKHDLKATFDTTADSTQICIYCHAPHNAKESLPLWNRTNPTNTFLLYSGIGMANKSFKTGFTTDSTSLFCMSCHDGVTDMNAIHNAGVIEGNNQAGGVWTDTDGVFASGDLTGLSGNLTTDLRKTHPINFVVRTDDIQTDLNTGGNNPWMGPMAPTTVTALGNPTVTQKFPLFKSTHANTDRTTDSRSLECGSCHAVHDSQYRPFLRDTMDKSILCLGCHNK